MTISFAKKLTERSLEQLYRQLNPDILTTEKIVFSLKATEWISAEGIALIYSWFFKLHRSGKKFQVILPDSKTKNGKRLLEYLWGYWNICSFLPYDKARSNYEKLDEYFLIQPEDIRLLNDIAKKREQRVSKILSEDSDFSLILPLKAVELPRRSNQVSVEKAVESEISSLFQIESSIRTLLDKHTLASPIDNNILSHIIAWELVQNSIEHAYVDPNEARFCVCVLGITKNAAKNLQWRNELCTEEKSDEIQRFFRDDIGNVKSHPYLEFCFVDLGQGIFNSLHEVFANRSKKRDSQFSAGFEKQHIQTQVLEYAFFNYSSSVPLSESIENYDGIPRGLYFLLDYIRRYEGLLIARSGKGKVMYDFSRGNKEITSSVIYPESKLTEFSGSMVSIYLPSLNRLKIGQRENNFRVTAARPHFSFNEADLDQKQTTHYISLVRLQARAFKEAKKKFEFVLSNKQIKNVIIELLDQEIFELSRHEKNGILIVDFSSFHSKNIIRKILYYLTSTPRLSLVFRIVIANLADGMLIDMFNHGIDGFSSPYIYRPIPCIDFSSCPATDIERIRWIAVRDQEDAVKLKEVLAYIPTPSYTLPEFVNGYAIYEHFILFDKKGNIKKILLGNNDASEPVAPLTGLKRIYEEALSREIHGLLRDEFLENGDLPGGDCEQKQPYLFLTSRGHYQHQFISLYEPLHDKDIANYFGRLLLDQYLKNCQASGKQYFNCIASVTVSSQLIAIAIRDLVNDSSSPYSLIKAQNDSKDIKLTRLSNYYSFDTESPFSELMNSDLRVLLVNDVISTGSLVKSFITRLSSGRSTEDSRSRAGKMVAVFSIADSRITKECFDEMNVRNHTWQEEERSVYPEIEYSTIDFVTLCDRIKILKPRYFTIPDKDVSGKPIKYAKAVKHINPILNAVVELKEEYSETKYILFENPNDFFELIGDNYLNLGHIQFNPTHNAYNIDLKLFFGQLRKDEQNTERKKVQYFLEETAKRLLEKEKKLYANDIKDRLSAVFNKLIYNLQQLVQFKGQKDGKLIKLIDTIDRYQLSLLEKEDVSFSYYLQMQQVLLFAKENAIDNSELQAGIDVCRELLQKMKSNISFQPDVIFYPVFSAAEELMYHKEYISSLFGCDPENILALQRYDTNTGWRFAFPPKIYNLIVRHRTIMIFDSGSITGESIIQMIDAISIYEPARIIVLSLLGRIEDFNREFFSRIREMKVKHLLTDRQQEKLREANWRGGKDATKQELKKLIPEDIVPIHIYFGTNTHQFAYQSKEFCPYCEETKLLEKIRSDELKRSDLLCEHYINNRLKDIAPQKNHSIQTTRPPSYLPLVRPKILAGIDETKEAALVIPRPPFKEIFNMRDLVGKIAGYRFYPEYFDEVNQAFQVGYENNSRNYELLIAVFVHEPKLLKPFKDLLPNYYRQLCDFSLKIITGEKEFDTLYYKWTKFSFCFFFLELNHNKDLADLEHYSYIRLLYFAWDDLIASEYLQFKLLKRISRPADTVVPNIISHFLENKENIYEKIGCSETHPDFVRLMDFIREAQKILKYNKADKNRQIASMTLHEFFVLDPEMTNHSEFFQNCKYLGQASASVSSPVSRGVEMVVGHLETVVINNLNVLRKDAYFSERDTLYTCFYAEPGSVCSDFRAIKLAYTTWRDTVVYQDPSEKQRRTQLHTLIHYFLIKLGLRRTDKTEKTKYVTPGLEMETEVQLFKNFRSNVPELLLEQIRLQLDADEPLKKIGWNLSGLRAATKNELCVYIHANILTGIFRDIVMNKIYVCDLEGVEIDFEILPDPSGFSIVIIQNKPFENTDKRGIVERKINRLLDPYGCNLEIISSAAECRFEFFFLTKIKPSDNETIDLEFNRQGQ